MSTKLIKSPNNETPLNFTTKPELQIVSYTTVLKSPAISEGTPTDVNTSTMF